MKSINYLFVLLFLCSTQAFAQISITSSNTLDCTTTCTTLTAHVVGDTATNAGITSDDVYSPLIPIGFSFNFYGTPYSSVVIGANGTVGFTASLAGGGDPWPITAALLGNTSKLNSICGPWCDIDIFYTGTPIGTETYATVGTAPNRKFIVSWCDCSMFSCGTQRITTQIVLYESTNEIEVHLQQKEICTAWNPSSPAGAGGRGIIGVQNAAGTAATVAPARDWEPVWGAINESWRFTPNTAGTAYTVASIPYAPQILTTATIYWYNVTAGTYLGTGTSQLSCPTTPTLYRACVLVCGDSVFADYLVSPVPPVIISLGGAIGSGSPYATKPVTLCGDSDGSFTVLGLTPGLVDTIYYTKDGVAQPPIIATVNSDGAITVSGLPSGTYDNIIAHQGSCITDPQGPVVIPVPTIPLVGTQTNPSICGANDGSLILSGLYPSHIFTINYNIDGVAQPPITTVTDASGTITLSGLLDAKTYSNIIASYGTGCATASVGPFPFNGPPPANVNIVSVVSPTECGKCNGIIRIRPVAPFSSDTVNYTYNTVVMPSFVAVTLPDSTVFLPGLCAGSYYAMSLKIGHCVTPVNGTAILTDPPLTAHFSIDTVRGCHGDSLFFHNLSSSTGALYYLWSFGDGSSDSVTNPVHVYPEGTYTVHLTSTNHYCNSYDSSTFSLGHPLKAIFTETPDILCQGQTAVTTNASIGATGYQWFFSNTATDNTTSPSYTYQRSGDYNLTLIAHNDIPCYDTLVKKIAVDTISKMAIKLTDSVACSGTYMTMTGQYPSRGNTGITWTYGDNQSMENINPVKHGYAAEGIYTVTATAHYRVCPDATASRLIHIYQQPNINIGKDTSICKGSEAITLSDHMNNTPLAGYVWNTGEKTKAITITTPGKYYATVNINNCYATDTIEVSNDCYVNLPNAFTPNGDGINDYFFPRQLLSKGLIQFKMSIYNRWGQLIFETETLDGMGWDGKLNGVDQPSGVYVYNIDATFRDGQHEHHQGNITLLR